VHACAELVHFCRAFERGGAAEGICALNQMRPRWAMAASLGGGTCKAWTVAPRSLAQLRLNYAEVKAADTAILILRRDRTPHLLE
jgi:hypothetical protein